MPEGTRQVRLRALAKINLTLEVLHKRTDGFHEIRTIFQTISLADRLEIGWTPARRTSIALSENIPIEDNLVVRAAEAVLKELKVKGEIRFRLTKKIPMGGGLGGGSTDAAAVLLALPVLVGRRVCLERLLEIGASLGSDVPFFLIGGTALGLGRGTELYPLPDAPAGPGLIVNSGLPISTADAYRALTLDAQSPKINISQRLALALGAEQSADGWSGSSGNDFEPVVFQKHPQLSTIRRNLEKAGGRPARMTGSGSGVYALFASVEERRRAVSLAARLATLPFSFVGRSRYRALWRRQLGEHVQGNTWPPQSRHSQ